MGGNRDHGLGDVLPETLIEEEGHGHGVVEEPLVEESGVEAENDGDIRVSSLPRCGRSSVRASAPARSAHLALAGRLEHGSRSPRPSRVAAERLNEMHLSLRARGWSTCGSRAPLDHPA